MVRRSRRLSRSSLRARRSRRRQPPPLAAGTAAMIFSAVIGCDSFGVRWLGTAMDVWRLLLNQTSKHPERCRATALQKAVKPRLTTHQVLFLGTNPRVPFRAGTQCSVGCDAESRLQYRQLQEHFD